MKNKNVSKVIPNGSVWEQTHGSLLTVLDFLGGSNFLVQFNGSPVFKAQGKEIKNGKVFDRNTRTVYGVGYLGYGCHKGYTNGSNTPAYEVWNGIISRCYNKGKNDFKRYGGAGVYVASKWHNFQNFAKWYYDMISKMPEGYPTKFDVDKDLKGGKCYSEDNCILLPYKLNNFIQNKAFSFGMGYVKNTKNSKNRITTTISLLGKQIYIGLHKTQAESDKSYNVAKNYVNRKMAAEYLAVGLINIYTAEMIMEKTNEYTLEDEEILFKKRPTLKGRIDGLFTNSKNLLQGCKYKRNVDLYKEEE